ncbi:MAG: Gfo/Idh/MocA family protein [Gemmatimonadaceae bacterium]
MNVLIVGLGSMGKRRVRNLQSLGMTDLAGVDVRADRRAEAESRYRIRTFPTLAAALEEDWKAAVISLPPDLHVEAAQACVARRIPFFVEASVVLEGLAELADDVDASGVVAIPSCTMRYFPGPRRIREIVESGQLGRALFWRYHSGQYLPDWHPWEPISEYYVSKRATGGCREIVPFELTWLTQVFGKVTTVRGGKHRVGELRADIDDLYTAELTQSSGLIGHLTVDVLSRPPVRDFCLIAAGGAIRWDGIANTLQVSEGRQQWEQVELQKGSPETGYINAEGPYIEEMNDFLASVRMRTPPKYSLRDDIEILKVLGAIERSSVQGLATRVDI